MKILAIILPGFILMMIIGLSACTGAAFENPQPFGVADILEIPEHFQGIYSNGDSDSLVVETNQISYYGLTSPLHFSLKNGDLTLRRWGDFWVVNLRNNDFWEVFLCKDYCDSLVIGYIPKSAAMEGDETFEWMKKYAARRPLEPSTNDAHIDFVLNPDSAAFREMVSKGFFKLMEALRKKSHPNTRGK